MTSPDEVLDATDWSVLEHAYGQAGGLARRLRDLLSGDPALAGDVLGLLDSAVLHQGTLYTATAPSARFVAAILADRATDLACASALPWDDRLRPLRAALIEWLGHVSASTMYADRPSAVVDDATHACQQIRPELYGAVAPFIWAADELTRAAALDAARILLRAPELANQREALIGRLLEDADTATPFDRAHRAVVLDAWGVPPRAMLSDPDPAVRAYAASRVSLDDAPESLVEVREALTHPDTVERWFDGRHPEPGFLHTLVEALLRRTSTFEDIENEAIAIVRAPESSARQQSLLLLYPRAFPPDVQRTPAQQRFRVLIDELRVGRS